MHTRTMVIPDERGQIPFVQVSLKFILIVLHFLHGDHMYLLLQGISIQLGEMAEMAGYIYYGQTRDVINHH